MYLGLVARILGRYICLLRQDPLRALAHPMWLMWCFAIILEGLVTDK